jgi:hypothetical protein
MQIKPYRSAIRLILLALVASVVFFSAFSCKKEKEGNPPLINFITGNGYSSTDTVVAAGQKVRIGIRASSGEANITYFSVRFNDGTSRILLDTGVNISLLVYNLEVIKTTAQHETWTFLVMNRNRIKDSVQISLTNSEISNWGAITTLNDIILGAQDNTTNGSFFSISGNSVMNLQQAFENQPAVDIIYYYGQYEGTLASPNEAEAPGFFTGAQGIAGWTIKNETRYDTTTITSQEFDTSLNDSLILAAYEPTAGKKKGKYILPGMVFSFKSQGGKLGLIKIQEVAPLPSGSVKMTIKVQQ